MYSDRQINEASYSFHPFFFIFLSFRRRLLYVHVLPSHFVRAPVLPSFFRILAEMMWDRRETCTTFVHTEKPGKR